MGLERRQTEDPRVLRETLDTFMASVDAINALDGTAIAAVKDVAAIKAAVTAVAAIKAGVTAVAAISDAVTAVAAMPVEGAPEITAGTEATGVIAVTLQAQTIAEADLEKRRILTVWISATDGGSPSKALADVAITSGAELSEKNGIIEIITDADGQAVINVTAKANGEMYVMAADNGVSTDKLTFAAVPAA